MDSFSLICDPWSVGPVIENRATAFDDPGNESRNRGPLDFAAWELGLWNDRFDRPLDPHTALGITAIWRCVSWISASIASIGWGVFERRDNGRERVPVMDDTSWVLDTQANPEMSAFEFRQVMLKDALTWRGGFAEIDRDGFGRLKWLWRLDPSRLTADRMANGQLVWVVDNGPGIKASILMPENVFHVKGLGPDGIVGYSPIEVGNRTLKLGQLQEEFSESFLKRGPMPGAVMTVPGATKEKRDEIREQVERVYGGARNRGRVFLLRQGETFTPLTLNHVDAQFIEQRRYSVEDIARIYGVPLHKLGDLTRATFSNIEHQSIEAVQDCLLPWCRRLETEADIKLFGQVNRGRRFTRLNLASLLRGDTASQTDALVKQVNGGLRTINEARAILDLNPVEDGDVLLIQGAMVTLDSLADQPELPEPTPEPAEPAEPTGDPSAEPAEPADGATNAFRDLLVDAFKSQLRVEGDKAKRAANKGAKELASLVCQFYGDGKNVETFAGKLRPILMAMGTTDANGSASRFAQLHFDASKKQIETGKLDTSDTRALSAARNIISELNS